MKGVGSSCGVGVPVPSLVALIGGSRVGGSVTELQEGHD